MPFPFHRAGEHIGDGSAPRVDIAVDPLDGTTLTAQGRSGAIAVRLRSLRALPKGSPSP